MLNALLKKRPTGLERGQVLMPETPTGQLANYVIDHDARLVVMAAEPGGPSTAGWAGGLLAFPVVDATGIEADRYQWLAAWRDHEDRLIIWEEHPDSWRPIPVTAEVYDQAKALLADTI